MGDGEHGRVAADLSHIVALDLDSPGPPPHRSRDRAGQDLTPAVEATGENSDHSADPVRRAQSRGVGRLIGFDLHQPFGTQARGIGSVESFDVAEQVGPGLGVIRRPTACVKRGDE